MKGVVSIISLILFASACKKKEFVQPDEPLLSSAQTKGLPQDKKISGYFYAEQIKYFRQNNHDTYVFLYSAFREPAADLVAGYDHNSNNESASNSASFGNINVGRVIYNNTFTLSAQSIPKKFAYSYASVIFPDTSAGWSIEGNRTFGPIKISPSRGFPKLDDLDTAPFERVSKTGFTLDIAHRASNYDSLVVIMEDYFSRIQIAKRIGPSCAAIFSEEELKALYQWTPYGYITICAYNYSNIMIENRVYVFELAKKYTQNITIVP